VEQALNNLSGISKLEVNLEKHEALVEYDSTLVTYETMASVLKDAGYTMGKPVD
jgi:copper chaperone CopZ